MIGEFNYTDTEKGKIWMDTQYFIDLENRYGAQNNKPLNVVVNQGKGLMVGVELVPKAGVARGVCE